VFGVNVPVQAVETLPEICQRPPVPRLTAVLFDPPELIPEQIHVAPFTATEPEFIFTVVLVRTVEPEVNVTAPAVKLILSESKLVPKVTAPPTDGRFTVIAESLELSFTTYEVTILIVPKSAVDPVVLSITRVPLPPTVVIPALNPLPATQLTVAPRVIDLPLRLKRLVAVRKEREFPLPEGASN
jgi:hypothetical protein